jgi:phosphonate transport system substrate-binding protein
MTDRSIWVGAVAYDPKVVTIWEGMRRYFHEEAGVPVEIVLFQSYETQVGTLLAQPGTPAPRIDIAWNTNLAYLQAVEFSAGRCQPIAMRDTDRGWTTKIVAPAGGAMRTIGDLRGHTLALGSRDSGHAAILPVHFLAAEDLIEERDYRSLRFNTDVGKHGDTGASELEVLKAVLDGTADAGALGSPLWAAVQERGIVPAGALAEVWTSPPYSHCMFTAAPGLDEQIRQRFADALYGMSWDDPVHRAVLDAEGLRRWMPPDADGYGSLSEACRQQGFFRR